MADNFLERQRADYEKRKKKWLNKKKHTSISYKVSLISHEDAD